jgi:hypothetical protein
MYVQGLLKDAIEFILHPNMDRQGGYFLCRVLKPLTNTIEETLPSS